ncbi:MAG TPA: succinylglutamate desuccinylase/aspartoacylase family protein, partial [Gammaproteobacteria bacterium]|nr:succinylglutamate desuccinylase/aspartoacylase family protein [Gammaproteobacteria bacterium]
QRAGPRLFVCAAIHGDEINGVEIIRRLLKLPILKRLRGALVAIPIVNVHGFISHSRYLPDRRDLNRSFPGSHKGSLAARLAHLFMEDIVSVCTHGIDLHTAAQHRNNLPQIRAYLDDAETERLARAFSVPVILNSDLRDGSLREAAAEQGIPMLLYEAGEALRFDEVAIRIGVKGILSVMRALDMLPQIKHAKSPYQPVVARSSTWLRAPEGGILRNAIPLGAHVKKGDSLATIADPFGERDVDVKAPNSGIVIGRMNLPLVNEGEALFHIARFHQADEVAATIEALQSELADEDRHYPDQGLT